MNASQPQIGVCYYPEHWPEEQWAQDAARMVELGITIVRIGEFAWSRLEPNPGQYDFDWLKRAMDVLIKVGIKIVLGTPTATPPKWLVDKMPDMLAVDESGQPRKFGSRRHYCFSHKAYRTECTRIVTELAKVFGKHDGLIAWQTDNEYGCHDTTLSWSQSAQIGFREWLAQKYQSPDALNKAWGNVFWSMEYREFDEIELPNQTVTEANPAHLMDFRRYASDQVIEFNQIQVAILRKYSPNTDLLHNYMGRILDFDHFKLGDDLDIASWDSYPLGFLEDRSDMDENWKRDFANAGDPDLQAFHHDLYRAVGNGRMWIMEQQPGPVNWAPHNPAPRDGMVALWGMEAIAHGAEVVSYFRWKQAPFAQEQMHSGLLLSNGDEAKGFHEVKKLHTLLEVIGDFPATTKADVALIFDYASAWAWQIQPQGKEFDYFAIVFDFYRGLCRAGLSVDIVDAKSADLSDYKQIIIPALFSWNEKLLAEIKNTSAQILIGPRSGSKTNDFSIPDQLPPNLPAELMPIKISHVESVRKDRPVKVGDDGNFKYWVEHANVSKKASVELKTTDGEPALVQHNKVEYLCGWPDDDLMDSLVARIASQAKMQKTTLPKGIRMRRRGDLLFIFNYGNETVALSDLELPEFDEVRAGSDDMQPSDIIILKLK